MRSWPQELGVTAASGELRGRSHSGCWRGAGWDGSLGGVAGRPWAQTQPEWSPPSLTGSVALLCHLLVLVVSRGPHSDPTLSWPYGLQEARLWGFWPVLSPLASSGPWGLWV